MTDNDRRWAFYLNIPNTNRAVLLKPLVWKDGGQIEDLKKMMEFFIDANIPYSEMKKILIYLSCCGSGKSCTLLHASKVMGRSIIVTPFKNLQRQYFDDYFSGNNKFILKKDGKKLNVSVFQGRSNFPCKYLEEEYQKEQTKLEESRLPEKKYKTFDIKDHVLRMYNDDSSCANKELPCICKLKGKGGGRIPRWTIASKCKHWVPSPMPEEIIKKWKNKKSKKKDEDDIEDILQPYFEMLGLDSRATSKEMENAFRESLKTAHQYEKNLTDNFSEKNNSKEKLIDAYSRITNPNYIINIKDENNEEEYSLLDKIMDMTNCSNIEYYESVGLGRVGVFIRAEKDRFGNPTPEICPYYKQFYSYINADVIVFNSAKWNLETQIKRKPKVDIEIFDEGDYFLDKLATTIELRRSTIEKILGLSTPIKNLKNDTLSAFDMSYAKIVKDVTKKSKETRGSEKIIDALEYKELFIKILNLIQEYSKESGIIEEFQKKILDLKIILKYIGKASLDYISGTKTKGLKIFIPYTDIIFKDLLQYTSKNIIITSGTMQSDTVLSSLYGINKNNYILHTIIGRKDQPGRLRYIKPDEHEMPLLKVTHTAWQNPKFRENYNKLLNYILDNLKIKIDQATKKPGDAKIIVLTPAKKYAEGILDRKDIFIDFAKKGKNRKDDNIQKKLIDLSLSEYVDNNIENIKKIKDDDIELDGDVLRTDKQIILSTKMSRGTDLKDNKCRAIVLLKWPTPDISDGYYQSLKKRFGDGIYWNIIRDRAEREAIQMVSRGLRHDLDWCLFASPDITAFNQIYRLFTGDK